MHRSGAMVARTQQTASCGFSPFLPHLTASANAFPNNGSDPPESAAEAVGIQMKSSFGLGHVRTLCQPSTELGAGLTAEAAFRPSRRHRPEPEPKAALRRRTKNAEERISSASISRLHALRPIGYHSKAATPDRLGRKHRLRPPLATEETHVSEVLAAERRRKASAVRRGRDFPLRDFLATRCCRVLCRFFCYTGTAGSSASGF